MHKLLRVRPGGFAAASVVWPVLAMGMLAACGGDSVTDPDDPVFGVEIATPVTEMLVGDVVQITATVLGQDNAVLTGRVVQWISDSPTTASVDGDGKLTAHAVGEALVTATAGGKSASTTMSVRSFGQLASQLVGPAGGEVSTLLPGAIGLALKVPANAVANPTTFSLQARETTGGTLARFTVVPVGVSLQKAVEILVTLAEPQPAGTLMALSYSGAEGTSFLPLTPDSSRRRLAVRTRFLGEEPTTSAVLFRVGDAEGTTVAAEGDLEMALLGFSIGVVKDSARVALTRARQTTSIALSQRLNGVMGVLALAQGHPNFSPDGSQLLLDWRAHVCGRLAQETTRWTNLSMTAPFGFREFFNEMDNVLSWWSVAQVLDDPDSQLGLPFQGCETDVLAALRTKSATFVETFIDELEALQQGDLVIRFNDFIDSHIPRTLRLKARLQQIGFEEFTPHLDEAIRVVFDGLRPIAWGACRLRSDHTYLEKLLLLEQSGAEQLTRYNRSHLEDDAEQCGTDLRYFVRDSTGATAASGHLGGTAAGAADRLADITLPVGGRLVIVGDLRWITCPGDVRTNRPPADNQEVVRVVGTVAPISATLVSRSVPSAGPRNYLRSDSLVFTAEGIREGLALTGDASGRSRLRLERAGLSCLGGYSSLPDPVTLVELNLSTDEIYSNRFEATTRSEWSLSGTTTSPTGQRFLGEMTSQGTTLTLSNLPDHTQLLLEFDLIIIDSWNGNGGSGSASAPDLMTFELAGGTILKRTTFSNKPSDVQAYPGDYPGGVFPAGTGARAINSLGYRPGSDHFGDSLYRIRLPFQHSSLSLTLTFGSQQTSGQNENWGIDNIRVLRVP